MYTQFFYFILFIFYFKHATEAGWKSAWREIGMGMWLGETGVVCLAVVCEFRVGFGFDFWCLTVVMGLISGGF